jgi:hypothetical protein
MTKQPFDRELAVWRKSTRSNGNSGNCVEWAMVDGVVGVRDSKNPGGTTLIFTPAEWTAFIAGVKGGEFDLTT